MFSLSLQTVYPSFGAFCMYFILKFNRDAGFHVPGVQQLDEEAAMFEALQERHALFSPGGNPLKHFVV